jgi:hypothetical protein
VWTTREAETKSEKVEFLCLRNSSMKIYELCAMLNGEGGSEGDVTGLVVEATAV